LMITSFHIQLGEHLTPNQLFQDLLHHWHWKLIFDTTRNYLICDELSATFS
jgi:hypothetical protein